jgi:hypothetical protein
MYLCGCVDVWMEERGRRRRREGKEKDKEKKAYHIEK